MKTEYRAQINALGVVWKQLQLDILVVSETDRDSLHYKHLKTAFDHAGRALDFLSEAIRVHP